MRPHQIFLLTVLPGLTCVAAELCGTVGISTTLPYYTSTSPALSDAVACGKHCALDTECQTYAHGLGMCLHYASPSSSIFEESSSSPWALYDRACLPVEAHRSQLVSPGAPCLIDPHSTKSRFRLLGPDFVPLVRTPGDQLQPRRGLAPTGEAGVLAVDWTSHYEEAPRFYFQQAASAPAGLYDIILPGSEKQYVAKAANGELVLTSASTGSTAQHVNGRTIVTSIFTVDCDGRIGAMHEGVLYSWNSSSFSARDRLPDNTLVALDSDMFRNHHELRSLVTRNTHRCPAGQHGIEKPGMPAHKPNGCGSGWSVKLVPELHFGPCCNAHDTCFSNCAEPSCEGCNNAFRTCMDDACKKQNPFKRVFCYGTAKLYHAAVDRLGCGIFNNKTKDRCDCVHN